VAGDDKRKRARRLTGWVVAVSVLAALGVTAGVASMAVQRGSAPAEAAVVAPPAPAWLEGARAGVRGDGFEWLDVTYAERVAIVTGDAPDERTAERGYGRAAGYLRGDDAATVDIDVIVNAVTVAGAAGVGAAAAALPDAPSVEACQQAFRDTLAGRFVGFERSSARITRESAMLLDALTGVAIRCRAHRIEIGGHTDLSGSPPRNLILSQDRADAVRNYLAERGVPVGQLAAIGYGDTAPLIDAQTPEADTANRRIEFIVTAF
jgi:outer membrane protein OmpA-like peptidoglycan-associated protein